MRGCVLCVVACLLLTGCKSVPAISCDNADRLRAAATLAITALERVCPMAQN